MALRMIMLFGIVVADTWLVAALGEQSVAAMGLADAIGGLLLGAQNAFSNAAQILVARAWGSGKASALKDAFVSSIAINIAVCCVGLALLFGFGDLALQSTAQTPEVYAQARIYLIIFTGVIVAEALGQSLSAFFNGCGDTKSPLYSYLVSVPVNLLLSYALIHGHAGLPQMGLAGAAVGSVVGAALRTGYLIYCVVRMEAAWKNAVLTRFKSVFWDHLKFALPIAATFFSARASTTACTFVYASYDVYQFAALTLIQPWIQVVGTFGMAWAQATGIVVAQKLGSDKDWPDQVAFLRMVWKGAFITAFLVSVVYLAVILSTDIFYSALDEKTKTALLTFIPVLILLPWPKNSNAICGNTLRAAGRTVYVMNIFLGSQWLFKVPATIFLVLFLKAPVVWALSLFLLEEIVKFLPFHWTVPRWFKGPIAR